MKKITLFVLSIVALASAASAQGLVVTQNDFTNNCDNYRGQVITVNAVNLRPKQAVTAISVGAPASVTVGSGSTANVVASCKVIKGQKSIDVDFTSSPTFAACFYIKDDMFAKLPVAQETIKSNITFKGEKATGFFISDFKL
jgi:hypothetical protein